MTGLSQLPLRRLAECWDYLRVPLNSEERHYRPGDIPYWGANSIQGYVDEALVHEEVVLIGEDGAPFFDRDRPVAFHSIDPIWPNNHIHVLKPNLGVDARWLAYALNDVDYSLYVLGSTRDKLTQSALMRITLPTPPQPTQSAIADYLDRETARIDTLVEEQQRLIEMLRERRSAVIDAALAPSDTWERTTLKYMLSGVDQGVSPQAEAGLADEPGTWGVLKTGCVNRGTFRPEEHKRLPGDFVIDPAIAVGVGDIIVSRASGSPDLVGSAAIVEHLNYQLILSDKLFRLRPQHSVDPRFLAWSLNSGQYRIQVRRSISGAEGLANNLPLSKLRAFEMHHPLLDDQRRIAAYLDEQTAKIDALITETERFIELARERRAALITAAVTGQIDVREMV